MFLRTSSEVPPRRRRSRRVRALFTAGLLSLLPGWTIGCIDDGERIQAAPSRPNVIIAVFDSTRFDDWSFLTPERGVTPVMDTLSSEGQRFSNAYSLYTLTVPSHVSIFTGHAVLTSRTPPNSPLRQQRFGYRSSSLFTILGDHGYRTFAFSGNKNILASTLEALEAVHVSDEELHTRMSEDELSGILRSYGEYVMDPGALPDEEMKSYDRNRRVIMGNADNVNAAVFAAMEEYALEVPVAPYFLFVNYNDAHDPYFPPAEYADRFRSEGSSDFNGNIFGKKGREDPPDLGPMELSMTSWGLSEGDIQRARELHLGELAYADARFGELLAWLEERGLLESTVIVGVADHGELFGEYGRMSHAGRGNEELLHVPLFFRFLGAGFPPAVIESRVDLRDIKPTLLAYLGIEDHSSMGRNLLPLIDTELAAAGPLPASAAGPERDANALGDENLIEGQGQEAHEQLRKQLEALGYIESGEKK